MNKFQVLNTMQNKLELRMIMNKWVKNMLSEYDTKKVHDLQVLLHSALTICKMGWKIMLN